MKYRVAWDHDFDNPNPHALSLDSTVHETENDAQQYAEQELADAASEGYYPNELPPYVVVEDTCQ